MLLSKSEPQEKKKKAHKCKLCSFTTIYPRYLARHINSVHEKVRPAKNLLCKECNYRCSTVSGIKLHENAVHKNMKDKSCQLCNYKTADPANLRRHVKTIHLGIFKFRCELCNFKGTSAVELRTHDNAVHKNVKDAICQLCKFTTSYQAHLRRHKKVVHGNKSEVNSEGSGINVGNNVNLKGPVKDVMSIGVERNANSTQKCKLCDFLASSEDDLTKHLMSTHVIK